MGLGFIVFMDQEVVEIHSTTWCKQILSYLAEKKNHDVINARLSPRNEKHTYIHTYIHFLIF